MRCYHVMPGIVARVAVAAAVMGAIAPAVRAADAWSEWQGLPDRYQGKVSFRLLLVSKPAGFRFQLRNQYPQKVTVTFAIAGKDSGGAPLKDEHRYVLEPGEQKVKGDDQRVPYTELSSAAISAIHFDGAEPAPSLGGFYMPSIIIPALQKAIENGQKVLEQLEQAQTEADATYSSLRSTGDVPHAVGKASSDQSGITGNGQVNDVDSAETAAQQAGERAQSARAALKKLKSDLVDMQEADAKARADGERRYQAALSGATAAPAPGVTVASPIVVNPPAPIGTPAAAPFVKATLTEDQMKTLYKQGQDAYNKKNWPGVEAAFKPLLAGCGDTIQPGDRAMLYYHLGTAYDNDNKAPDAESAYGNAVQLGLKDDSLDNDLAVVEYSQHKPADAEKSERAAIALKKDNASYYFNLGLICMAQKKFKDAEDAYKGALKLDADNENYKKHLQTAQDAEKAAPSN